MIGIHRRKRVEGWAVDVSSAESKGAPSTIMQRLGEDNRLWLVAMGIIVIAAFWLILRGQPGVAHNSSFVSKLPACNGSYDDAKHQEITALFMSKKILSGPTLEAKFAGPGNFRLLMPSNCSPDDILYCAESAAAVISRRLHERPVVNVYLRKLSNGDEWKYASLVWRSDKDKYILKRVKTEDDAL